MEKDNEWLSLYGSVSNFKCINCGKDAIVIKNNIKISSCKGCYCEECFNKIPKSK